MSIEVSENAEHTNWTVHFKSFMWPLSTYIIQCSFDYYLDFNNLKCLFLQNEDREDRNKHGNWEAQNKEFWLYIDDKSTQNCWFNNWFNKLITEYLVLHKHLQYYILGVWWLSEAFYCQNYFWILKVLKESKWEFTVSCQHRLYKSLYEMFHITGYRSINLCCQEYYVGIITLCSNINKDVSFTAHPSSVLHINGCCSHSQRGETSIIKLPDSINLGAQDTPTRWRQS